MCKYFLSLLLFLSLISSSPAKCQVNTDEFAVLIQAFENAFPELESQFKSNFKQDLKIQRLLINFAPSPMQKDYWWSLNAVHASYSSLDHTNLPVKDHMLFLFGGYAQLEGLTVDALAKVLCHEMGHGFAGPPFKKSGTSQEGQADYYATKSCLKVVFQYLPEDPNENQKLNIPPEELNFAKTLCKNHSSNPALCLRGLKAIYSDLNYLKISSGIFPNWQEPSNDVAEKLDYNDYFYPESSCRIDTEILGWFNKPRPLCWFPGGMDRKTLLPMN